MAQREIAHKARKMSNMSKDNNMLNYKYEIKGKLFIERGKVGSQIQYRIEGFKAGQFHLNDSGECYPYIASKDVSMEDCPFLVAGKGKRPLLNKVDIPWLLQKIFHSESSLGHHDRTKVLFGERDAAGKEIEESEEPGADVRSEGAVPSGHDFNCTVFEEQSGHSQFRLESLVCPSLGISLKGSELQKKIGDLKLCPKSKSVQSLC